MWKSYNAVPYEMADHPFIGPFHLPAQFDGAIYDSDEFFMYSFKVKRCSRTRSHDWTACPFAHPGETAARRDPRRFGYCALPCPEFRHTGACVFGDACLFAHGVFEHWLHPEMYRTRMCTSRLDCQRQVCFFAHTLWELRAGEPTKCHYVHEPWPEVPTESPRKGLVDSRPMASPSPVARPAAQTSTPPAFPECALSAFTRGNDFLASLSGISVKAGEDKGKSVYVSGEVEPNFPNIGRVEEVVVD